MMNEYQDQYADDKPNYVDVIRALVERNEHISREKMCEITLAILAGHYSDLQTTAILTALSCKGETAQEIAGAVDAVLKRSNRIFMDAENIVDIGGTGGDHSGTYNISTTAAFIAAAAGACVIKHGNKAVTSCCGSSDMIAALGVNLERCSQPKQIKDSLDACNFAFAATPFMHYFPPGFGELRRALGIRTVFNLIGPLVHPASIRKQIIGVSSASHVELITEALSLLGREEAFVVYGHDGLDEVSCAGKTTIAHVCGDTVNILNVNAEDFGLPPCRLADLAGGSALHNAQLCLSILEGDKGPCSDTAIMAAGALLVLSGNAVNFTQGVVLARAAVESGKATQVCNIFRRLNA